MAEVWSLKEWTPVFDKGIWVHGENGTVVKEQGKVKSGPYAGQSYEILAATSFPGWWSVLIREEHGKAYRDIKEEWL
jgi:hypothetical protein